LSELAEQLGDMFVEVHDVVVNRDHELLEVAQLSANEEIGRGRLNFAIQKEDLDQGSSTSVAVLNVSVLRVAKCFGTLSIEAFQDARDHHVVVLHRSRLLSEVRHGRACNVFRGECTILRDEVAKSLLVVFDGNQRRPVEIFDTHVQIRLTLDKLFR
jgi:hypothetical protein